MESKTNLWKYLYPSQRVFAKLSALLSCYTTNKINDFVVLPYAIVLTFKPVRTKQLHIVTLHSLSQVKDSVLYENALFR